ncbi:LytTR family DNA-binding domain-containing protein [Caulobacter sp. UNC358MFTsu5.1]|uniref:LytTR family DNA-binding domain-containing protein n=1 Tax=Caulobacter sp. UNC358MFTsu5.1 TaxID=1449049 RepID=UPI0009DD92F1|nr:LytTR family DNA-binding domain-containing protein [Caulobacter sp. UNC358MFTsu5.1]
MREKASAVRERRAPAIGEAPTTTVLKSYLRPLVVAVIAGAFLALIGALGTGDSPLVSRLVYWIGLSSLGAVLGTTVALTVDRLWPGLDSTWWRALAIVTVLTPLFTVLVWVAGGRTPLTLQVAATYFGITLVMTAGMTALMTLATRPTIQTHAAPPEAPPPRFLERLPPRLRGSEIYAVEAEDHYLRLHTSKGQDLILLRLCDAVAELEGIEGAQTHRSWWVAKAAVRDARRGDGRATLTLTSGVEAPVSRAYARMLRKAGWY